MKTKFILFTFLQLICGFSFSQYIAVRARYTQTRLVDNSPHAPSRENRLVLTFFNVGLAGIYTPATLSNYDIYVFKGGLEYGSYCGGVADSCGNNYPGYNWTAPQAVSYYNSYFPNWIDCDPNAASHYVANGNQLDCGFIQVSYWETDDNGVEQERFTAPNVCLPIIYILPFQISGNVILMAFFRAPYNWYSFACYNSPQEL